MPTTASHASPIPAATRLARLYEMDLSALTSKATYPGPEGLGWTAPQAAEAELWYRRFWHAIILHPTERLVPNHAIDEMWHLHILDTAAYRRDCAHVLGYFLDHYPYYGLRGDAPARDDSFARTNAIYRRLFGADCRSMRHFDRGIAQTCGGGCSTGCGTNAQIVSVISCGGQAVCHRAGLQFIAPTGSPPAP